MAILRFDPFRGFEKMSRRMNELVDDLNKGVTFETGGFNPRVDIIEDKLNVTVQAELSGISKDDVKITVNDENVLTIKGEKKRPDDNKTYLRTERFFGSFTRSFYLPENLNTDQISANFDNGVLTLTIPKVEPPLPKEIEIDIK